MEEAFANAALAMFNYMTPLEGVGVDPALTRWVCCGWAWEGGTAGRQPAGARVLVAFRTPAPHPQRAPSRGAALPPARPSTFEAAAHDLPSLLFAFLDELLFTFATELLVCCDVAVDPIDRDNWRVQATGWVPRGGTGAGSQQGAAAAAARARLRLIELAAAPPPPSPQTSHPAAASALSAAATRPAPRSRPSPSARCSCGRAPATASSS
jgi:hypothetical protein